MSYRSRRNQDEMEYGLTDVDSLAKHLNLEKVSLRFHSMSVEADGGYS